MAIVAPLTDPSADPWLAPFARDRLSWWLLRGAGTADLGNALADLVTRVGAGPDRAWVVLLEGGGSSERVRYVSAAVATGGRATPRRGDRCTVLGPLSSGEAVAILDRGETAPVSALFLMTDRADVPAAVGALIAEGFAGAPERALAVVMRHAGDEWAAVGLVGDGPPAVAGARISRSARPVPPAPLGGRGPVGARRGGGGQPAVSLAVAVVGLVALGSFLTLRAHHGPTVGSARLSNATHRSAPDPAPGAPEPGNQPALAFDPERGDTVLFGGVEPAARTWLLTGQRWTPVATSAAPSDRFGAAVAYDAQMRKVLLFGGRQMDGAVVDDTWAWDGANWSSLVSSKPAPPGWEFSGMAWDEERRQMVLVMPPNVGLAGGAAVTWTLGRQGWERAVTATSPPAEPSAAVAFDPSTRTVLLVLSGLSPGASPSTWSWDGTTWHQLHPAHQPDLGGFTSYLAPIPGARQLILVRLSVGSPQALETWIWDGHDWTLQHAAVTPTELVGVIADEAARRVIAIGRGARGGGVTSAWQWTGGDWLPVPLHRRPSE